MAPNGDIQLFRPAPLWKRALAQLADLALLVVVGVAFSGVVRLSYQWGTMLPTGLLVVLWQSSLVGFVALLGATPGKLLLRLRVSVPGQAVPGWRRAWNRQAPFLAVQILSLVEQAGAMARLGPGATLDELMAEAATNPSGWGWAAHLAFMVVWVAALFVLMRPDRRGLHDLWADSVVVEGRSFRAWRA
jgi:uncharacterized RDD family membrane protein YckC